MPWRTKAEPRMCGPRDGNGNWYPTMTAEKRGGNGRSPADLAGDNVRRERLLPRERDRVRRHEAGTGQDRTPHDVARAV